VGKPLGILLVSGVLVRTRLAAFPRGIGWRHLVVLGLVAGVGFTMALFIAQLAFADAQLLGAAKLGVLAASGGAAVLALLCGRALLKPARGDEPETSADEAESSDEL
jgi:NhaA family Na+:H+ antiporter